MSALHDVSIFQSLTEEDAVILESHGRRRRYEKNFIVVQEGDEGSSMFVILTGRVSVYTANADGKRLWLRDMVAGDYFGEYALFDDSPRSATIHTAEPSEFLEISRDAVLQTFAQSPDAAFGLIQDLVGRIRDLTLRAKALALANSGAKVVFALLSVSVREDGVLVTEVPLTVEQIAERVGVQRETASRALTTLKRKRCVTERARSGQAGAYFEIDPERAPASRISWLTKNRKCGSTRLQTAPDSSSARFSP